MPCSRAKGAAFERQIAGALQEELGIKFRRHLTQYQEQELGDLQADDPAWPYELELKRHQSGPVDGLAGWWQQACRAAYKSNKLPALIYKYDRHAPRVVVHIQGIRCNVTFEDFCKLARDEMAKNAGY